MGEAPQSLLRPSRCPACGRPGRELLPCPWCGEGVPAAPRTRGDLARVVAGLAALAAGGTGFFAAGSGAPAGRAAALSAGFLSGWLLFRGGRSGAGGSGRRRDAAAAALAAALAAAGTRLFAVPFPLACASRAAWLFPALAAALFALRVPAEEPDAPASGTPRGRAWRRAAPDVLAAASLAPFAASFASGGPALLPLAGLAAVLGVWLSRLARPAVPRLLSAAVFSLLLPDPAAFAFGILSAPFADR